MGNWSSNKFSEIATFKYGTMPKKEFLNTGEYPTFSGYKYQYLYPKLNCNKGTLIVVARGVGGTGDVKIAREDCYLTNLSIKIESNQSLALNKFLLYYFRVNGLRYLDSGSAQSQITIRDLERIQLTLPPIEEQKAIAGVLSSLDDKIDLLHRQNKTLESMAEALFRHHFIDNAKPDWEDGVLPMEFDYTMGLSPPGSSYNNEGVGTPMFQGNADFSFRFPENRIYTTEAKRLAQPLDTLISVRAPVGAQNMAKEECCIGRGVAVFRYKSDNSFYTYTYFKMKSLMREIEAFNDTGTVFGAISKSDFERFSIVIPPKAEVEGYETVAKPLNDKVISNCTQIKILEKLRDTLLPKLMSGEVRVQYEEVS